MCFTSLFIRAVRIVTKVFKSFSTFSEVKAVHTGTGNNSIYITNNLFPNQTQRIMAYKELLAYVLYVI